MGKTGNQTRMTEFQNDRNPYVKKGATFICLACKERFPQNSSHQSYCVPCSRTTRQRMLRQKVKRTNPLKWKIRMLYTSLHGMGILVPTEKIAQWIKDTPTCTYCKNPIPLKEYSVDHIIPRSREGPNTLENIHLICLSCNMMKGNLLDGEYRALLEFLKDKPSIHSILKQRLKASGWMYGRS